MASTQPALQEVAAVQNLLHQVERNVVVLVRGFEAKAGIALLQGIETARPVDLLLEDLFKEPAHASPRRGAGRGSQGPAALHEAGLGGNAAEVDRGRLGYPLLQSERPGCGT